MIPKAVGVAVQIEHHGSVQEPVEHGRGDGGVTEDLTPLNRKWHRFILSEIACELAIRAGLGSRQFSRWNSVRVGATLTSKVGLTCVA